ncbi:MAG: hypothetical protein N3B10_03505 [Armatimonadetes bacterium]|nr:hypothetical protein [Armatimonadota bacterium]
MNSALVNFVINHWLKPVAWMWRKDANLSLPKSMLRALARSSPIFRPFGGHDYCRAEFFGRAIDQLYITANNFNLLDGAAPVAPKFGSAKAEPSRRTYFFGRAVARPSDFSSHSEGTPTGVPKFFWSDNNHPRRINSAFVLSRHQPLAKASGMDVTQICPYLNPCYGL